ncbi:ERMES complex subunit mmm1 [Ascosphaera pollenicola]|nr:ERMES complex subunit mmm1 [Ascosphaera pollenicola]
MPSCEEETGISRCLQADLHYSGIPTARVVKIYDLALSRGSSVDNLLEHALQSHQQHYSPTHLDDEYCVILHVQPPHHEFSTKLRCEYNSQTSLLIVQMPPKYPHAEAVLKLYDTFKNQITAMGLEEEVVAGADAEVSWGDTGIITKTPDCYWRPKGRDVRPTMIMEVEVTPSAQKVLGDARIWLSNQDYQPIVLTVQVIASEQKVIVACWEREGETIQQRGQV